MLDEQETKPPENCATILDTYHLTRRIVNSGTDSVAVISETLTGNEKVHTIRFSQTLHHRSGNCSLYV